jgi:hypothetical protein
VALLSAHSYRTCSLALAFSPQNTQVARASSFTPSLRTASTTRAATMPTLRSGKATPAITMMAKKSVKDLKDTELKGKKVLIRCDLNVPLDGKKITDDTRIRASVETIKYLVGKGARVAVSRPRFPRNLLARSMNVITGCGCCEKAVRCTINKVDYTP